MFEIGDYAFNQTTGHHGKVIGYGHQMLLNGYTTTLKVLVAGADSLRQQGFVEEDLYSAWTKWSGEVLSIPQRSEGFS